MQDLLNYNLLETDMRLDKILALTKYRRTRRNLLSSALGVFASTALPLGSVLAAKEDDQQFLLLSSRLTGVELAKLNPALGKKIKAVFSLSLSDEAWMQLREPILTEPFDDATLADKLARLGLTTQAQALANLWYVGSVSLDARLANDATVKAYCQGGLQEVKDPVTGVISSVCLVTYDEALVWTACTFTKPPANCGGAFGYWQNPA